MWHDTAIPSAFLPLCTAVAGCVDRSWIAGPIVSTVARIVLAPLGFGVPHLDNAAEAMRLLTEAALVHAPRSRTRTGCRG